PGSRAQARICSSHWALSVFFGKDGVKDVAMLLQALFESRVYPPHMICRTARAADSATETSWQAYALPFGIDMLDGAALFLFAAAAFDLSKAKHTATGPPPYLDDARRAIARVLAGSLQALAFPSVSHLYSPLIYRWSAHREYLQRYGSRTGRILLVGMNPGPW